MKNFCFLILLFCCAHAYKPVFFMHGIGSSQNDWDKMVQWVQQSHPGTPTFALDAYNHQASFDPLYTQIAGVRAMIGTTLQANNFTSFHLVCHSQGALICRTMLQAFPHSCDTFISLSGPQMGQFGLAGEGDWIMERFPNITADLAWLYLYTAREQDRYSPANYWRDPYHEEAFLRRVVFLPIMNNETFNDKSQEFKDNFLQLQKLVLYGSPDDGTIVPWQSAFFGYWSADKKSMVAMENQSVYTNDYFGLRSLNEQGRLVSLPVPGVEHEQWLKNQALYTKYIDPYLT
eukprot:TRINITY_DN30953_c0_g1_i1.p2 TRINITY_DN30953_c0_g1~~TRINITY_DN30953_c0_g1_i1.p2  ORF type:complete len:289 (-),score=48.93 TRINITY_DN30953_c0_g1_i1:60-926(-)